MKTLEDWIEKRHVRYMPPPVQEELKARVPNCQGGPAEALFWVLNGLQDYPACRGCGKKLSSFHWEPFLRPEHRTDPGTRQGYRPYCGRSCSYRFGTRQENYKRSCLKKYGVAHPMQREEVAQKTRRTNPKRHGDGLTPAAERGGPEKNDGLAVRGRAGRPGPEEIAALEAKFEVTCLTNLTAVSGTQRARDLVLEWRHRCGKIYSSGISDQGIRACPACSTGVTEGENDIISFMQALGLAVERRNREVIAPHEIDIWLPARRVGIELDGTSWHTARFESRQRCLERVELAERAGIQLVTIQEHLWLSRPDLVKNRLRSIVGKNDRLPARKTEVRQIDSRQSATFLWHNHLQGPARASVHLGLFHDDQLVGVMTMGKPRWAKKYDWELIRMGFKAGLTVVGGAAKLLAHFRQRHPGSIISYADRCWSTGNVYRQLGFRFSHTTAPSYWWCHHSLGTYARYQSQKKKLPQLLAQLGRPFYPELTEDENMTLAGFLPIYDRGTSAWILN